MTGLGPRVHVVGAGLAGLACAVRLAAAGRPVVLYEAAQHAGGRCRSYHDAALDRVIDNGSHLMLAAYRETLAFLDRVGARDRLVVGPAEVPFVDLRDGAVWRLRPNAGRLPWWILRSDRRVPGTHARHYLEGLRVLRAPPGATVGSRLDPGSPLFERLWRPLVEGIMNAAPEEADARTFARAIRETLGRGGTACRPLFAPAGLSDALVAPALAYLAARGAEIRFGARLRPLERANAPGPALCRLDFTDGPVSTAGTGDDRGAEPVVLAVPAPVAADLVPGLAVPQGSRAIVNVHYRLDRPDVPAVPGFLGLVGSAAHWLFRRDDVLSVTVSAAEAIVDLPAEAIAARLWPDVTRALDLWRAAGLVVDSAVATAYPADVAVQHDRAVAMPERWRVVKEKRATFLQTPAQQAARPKPPTVWTNLHLAGDWTDTGLPATIEGAVWSGHRAAAAVLRT